MEVLIILAASWLTVAVGVLSLCAMAQRADRLEAQVRRGETARGPSPQRRARLPRRSDASDSGPAVRRTPSI